MSLSREQINALLEKNYKFVDLPVASDDFNNVQLINVRQETLAKRSDIVNIGNDQHVRIYKPRTSMIEFNNDDAYGKGVDYIRGTLAILKYAKKIDSAQDNLKRIFETYKK